MNYPATVLAFNLCILIFGGVFAQPESVARMPGGGLGSIGPSIIITKAEWGRDKKVDDVTKALKEFVADNSDKFQPHASQWIFSNEIIKEIYGKKFKKNWQRTVFGKGPFPVLKSTLNVTYVVYGETRTAKADEGKELVLTVKRVAGVAGTEGENEVEFGEKLTKIEAKIAKAGENKGKFVKGLTKVAGKIVKGLTNTEGKIVGEFKPYGPVVVAPKGFEFDTGCAIDVAVGCAVDGAPTAYALSKDRKTVYYFIPDSLESNPWEELLNKDEKGNVIPGFRDIAASNAGDLIAIRMDTSDVVSFDFATKVWTTFPGKPSDLNIMKLCSVDESNIYAVAKLANQKMSLFKYNSKTPGWDEMPATEMVIDVAAAKDGTVVAINDEGAVFMMTAPNKWKEISPASDRFISLAVQNKDNVWAIERNLSLWAWTSSANKFEPVMGVSWKWNNAKNLYEQSGEESKPVVGFKKIAVNVAPWIFLIGPDGQIFHNEEKGYIPAVVTSAPFVEKPAISKEPTAKAAVKTARGRTAALRGGKVAVGQTTGAAAMTPVSTGVRKAAVSRRGTAPAVSSGAAQTRSRATNKTPVSRSATTKPVAVR